MKTIKLIVLALLISSCTKTWVCTTTTTSDNINMTYSVEVKGTTEEIQQIEDSGNGVHDDYNGGVIVQTTNCLKK